MRHQPFTILLHIALVIILTGALVTHFCGINGTLTLHIQTPPTSQFDKESGPGNGELPFAIGLDDVEIIYYPATTTPMDFHSDLSIDGKRVSVSMNKVGLYDNWRFYQSGISDESSTLSVSHDPWGIGITYTGYALLAISFIGFFFQTNTPWRSLLRKYRRSLVIISVILAVSPLKATPSESQSEPPLPVMQRPLAANLGKVLVYWNDRVCPLQTLARDITSSLYGSTYYMGYTPEQVLSGWLFYYDTWCRDYLQSNPQLKKLPPFPTKKEDKKAAEKLALVEWIGIGEIFKIYPYLTADGHMEWLSLTGRRPSSMPLEQWTFMQTSMPQIKELLLKGKNNDANARISCLIEGQRQYAGNVSLPSVAKIEAELWFNKAVRPAIVGIFAIVIGLATLILSLFISSGNGRNPLEIDSSNQPKRFMRNSTVSEASLQWISLAAVIPLFIYVAGAMGLLWWISGHLPLSNGPETMMFMAFSAFAGGCLCRNLTLRGGLMIVGAMSLFVTAMGGRSPQIGAMMPVLTSPLLSIHVMVVMISYALFLLIAILSAVALISHSEDRSRQLSVINRLLLTPAVCLLGIGIFIGAVWANQTWGRYWGWDPKETCALVMWLVYALPMHWASPRLAFFRRDRNLHIYLLSAIATVIFTYFGANYLLSGLHSYA